MDKIVQWFTVGRAIALALTVLAGGVGAGIGFVFGEGAARASLAITLDGLDKRLKVIEVDVTGSLSAVKEGLAEVRGELRALRRGDKQ